MLKSDNDPEFASLFGTQFHRQVCGTYAQNILSIYFICLHVYIYAHCLGKTTPRPSTSPD